MTDRRSGLEAKFGWSLKSAEKYFQSLLTAFFFFLMPHFFLPHSQSDDIFPALDTFKRLRKQHALCSFFFLSHSLALSLCPPPYDVFPCQSLIKHSRVLVALAAWRDLCKLAHKWPF